MKLVLHGGAGYTEHYIDSGELCAPLRAGLKKIQKHTEPVDKLCQFDFSYLESEDCKCHGIEPCHWQRQVYMSLRQMVIWCSFSNTIIPINWIITAKLVRDVLHQIWQLMFWNLEEVSITLQTSSLWHVSSHPYQLPLESGKKSGLSGVRCATGWNKKGTPKSSIHQVFWWKMVIYNQAGYGKKYKDQVNFSAYV